MKLRQLVIAALAVSGAATLAAANDMNANMNAQPLGSNDVSEVQQALKDKGFDAGPVDGVAGPKTQAALKQFQQAQGLQASGQLDDQTLAALESSGSSQAMNNPPSTSPFNPSDTTGQTSQASDRSMSSPPDISGSTGSVGSSQPPSSATASDLSISGSPEVATSQSQSQSRSTY